ncbi:unnamed protein product [Hapterophycus canaliculatus]
MQTLGNSQDVTVCRNCLGFVGDIISQLEILSGVPRHECVARHKKRCEGSNGDQISWARNGNGQHLTALHECLQGCGEVYCSPLCRSKHLERCHRLLCVGPISEEDAGDHPLVAFRIHAMQTNEIFLLVGEVMAQIATAYFSNKPHGSSSCGSEDILAAARAPFVDFVQELWWDVAVPRTDSDDGKDKKTPPPPSSTSATCSAVSDDSVPASFADTLRALCEESSALLRSAFAVASEGGGGKPLPAPLEQALSAEMFSRVVGMFEQNNVGVRAPSPISDVLRELLSRASSDEAGVDRCSDENPKISHPSGNSSQEIIEEVASLLREIMEEVDECEEGEEGIWPSCCRQVESGRSDDGDNHVALAPAGYQGVISSVIGELDMDETSSTGDESGLFAPLDGTALFSLICCMNHSCRPNCVVRYPGRRRESKNDAKICDLAAVVDTADPLVAEVLLLRDVSAGDELTQSYVTREMGLAERRDALQDYGFLCSCPQCVEEETAVAM